MGAVRRVPGPKPDTVTLMDRQVDALDRLMGELRMGLRDQRHFDELETRARGIAGGIVAAFRGGHGVVER